MKVGSPGSRIETEENRGLSSIELAAILFVFRGVGEKYAEFPCGQKTTPGMAEKWARMLGGEVGHRAPVSVSQGSQCGNEYI